MASKTITITEDVYQLLKKVKKKDESFSELLRRLAMQINGQKLEAFFGLWTINDQEYEEIQEEIKRNLIPFNGKKRKLD
jgi:predicted CopG family antitoxin